MLGLKWRMGPSVKEHKQPLKAFGKKMDPSLETLEGLQPCQHLNFRTPDSELKENKIVLF